MSTDVQKQIAQLLVRRCTNCYEELSGYNTKAWHWFAEGQVGPFCEHCWRLVVGPVISDPPVAAPPELATEPCPRCGTICPAGWCGVCHAPTRPPVAAPTPETPSLIEAVEQFIAAAEAYRCASAPLADKFVILESEMMLARNRLRAILLAGAVSHPQPEKRS